MIIALGLSSAFASVLPLWSRARSLLRSSVVALIPLTVLGWFTVVYALQANPGTPDKWIYVRELRAIGAGTLSQAFSARLTTSGEPAYVIFFWVLSRLGIESTGLFGVVGLVSVVAVVLGARLLLPTWRLPLVLFVSVSLGFMPSFASVVVRQGMAMSFMFIAICLILRGHRWAWAPFLAVATLFHHSVLPLTILLALLALIRLPLRVALVVWGLAAALFLTGLQTRVLGPIATAMPEIAEYTDPSVVAHYTGGVNRLDFLLLSAILLATGLFFRRLSTTPAWYTRLVTLFACLNVYFLLFGFIAYSDRLGAYSWLLAPLLLAAPLARSQSARSRVATVGVVAFVVVAGFRFGHYTDMLALAAAH
ncbi:EpsG family protein [Frondihabitans australicus]|uniref:EpsG-like putative glucosyltransferase n=1 Tax=Frondihabitans australicus TaxID=386892 RepID=A0A495IK08_9MICO|nr:EpsG family protein [Frondihabitans australicus]RKR76129.1 EpsG-like putative glucosyltransferase [Frondihabitans australicus]